MSDIIEPETQEEDATSLAESPDHQTADEAAATQAVEEEVAAPEAAAVQPEAEAEAETAAEVPSKLEKAFTRTKEEVRQLKGQVRDLQTQIAEYQKAELDRHVNELRVRYRLTTAQGEVLKRLDPEERETIARDMKPEGFEPRRSVLNKDTSDDHKPRSRTVDSIPTLPRPSKSNWF